MTQGNSPSQSRAARWAWLFTVALLLGLAVVTAGVMTMVVDTTLALILIACGAACTAISAISWVASVKSRGEVDS